MSIFYDTFYYFEECLELLGLSVSDSFESRDELVDEDKTPNKTYYVWMGEHLFASGIVIHRKYSKKTLLEKLEIVQKEAKAHGIPYCFIEQDKECFVCKARQKVNDIVFEGDYDGFERIAKAFDKSITKATLLDFQEAFRDTVKNHEEELGPECVKRLLNIEFKKKDVHITYNSIALTDQKENELFKALLGKYEGKYLYRYMSAASFYRILNDEKISMCSLNGMNDTTEIKYADDYCNIPPFIEIYPYPFDYTNDVRRANDDFISSCVSEELADDLTMWRLYGDNGKGVCLRFKVGKVPNDFYLAPVSYATEPDHHPELQFIVDLSSINIEGSKFGLYKLGIWKHFFKPYEYRTEKEIRLYKPYYNEESMKWISTQDGIYCPIIEFPITRKDYTYPLLLDAIILGPNFPHRKVNKVQIKHRLSQSDIKVNFWEKEIVMNSLITCYR